MKYYFTYGVGDDMDHRGGWTTIDAPDIETAKKLFVGLHPCRIPGVLACCKVYPEDEFKKTIMYAKGNSGHRELEGIIYWRDEYQES